MWFHMYVKTEIIIIKKNITKQKTLVYTRKINQWQIYQNQLGNQENASRFHIFCPYE